jgi:chromosome partitioning protein
MVRTLAFLATKGGSGKSTLALHIGVAALEDRTPTVLVDCDPQRSLSAWKAHREQAEPQVIAAGAHRIPEIQDAAQADGMGLLVVDGAPHADTTTTQLARAADLVVGVPLRPNAVDLAAISAAIAILDAARVRAVIVLSACPPRAPESKMPARSRAHRLSSRIAHRERAPGLCSRVRHPPRGHRVRSQRCKSAPHGAISKR